MDVFFEMVLILFVFLTVQELARSLLTAQRAEYSSFTCTNWD